MREARHQAVRPHFEVQIPKEVKLVWTIDEPPKLIGDDGPPSIVLVNVGFAPAMDVAIEVTSKPNVPFDDEDIAKLRDYFEARNMAFVGGGRGEHLTVWGNSVSAQVSGIFTIVGLMGKRVAVAHPGKPILIPIDRNAFEVSFFDVVRGMINAGCNSAPYHFWRDSHTTHDQLVVRYASQSGERLEQRISLRIKPSFLYQFSDSAVLDTTQLASDWESVELLFDVALDNE